MFYKIVTNTFDESGFRSFFIENIHGFEKLIFKIQEQNPFATPSWVAELEETCHVQPGNHTNTIEFINNRGWTIAITVIRIC